MAKQGSTDLVNIKAQLAKESTENIAKRVQANRGDKITVTQDKKFVLPDGSESPGPLTGVIVEFIASNTFYTTAYKRGVFNPPACFALGEGTEVSLIPSDNSPEKQNKDCAGCKQNVFPGGGQPKPCKNERLLAIVEDNDDGEAAIRVLKVSPTGIRAWDAYVKTVKEQTDMYPIAVVTDITFDPNLTYGSLRFKMAGENKNLALHAGRRKAAMERLMTEPDVSQFGQAAAPAPAKGGKRR